MTEAGGRQSRSPTDAAASQFDGALYQIQPKDLNMTHDAPMIDHDLADGISGTHLRAPEKVFQHPLTHNLTLREVKHLFEAIGTAEVQHNSDLMLRIGDEHLSLKAGRGKDLDATEVMSVRHLLVRAGYSDKAIEPATQAAPASPDR